jgi:hypothetical protein
LPAPVLDIEVSDLLGDALPAAAAAGMESDAETVSRLSRELDTIRRAMTALHDLLRGERLVASAAICNQVRPEYERLARATVTAAAALSEALVGYAELTDGFRREGVAWAELGALAGVDELHKQTNSPLAKLLQSAVEAGHLARLPRSQR